MIIRNTATLYTLSFFLVLLSSFKSAEAYEFQQYQGFALKIYGNISESYSNNVTFASKGQTQVESFLTNMGLRPTLQYQGKRSTLVFLGSIDRRIRSDTSDFINPSENASLRYSYEVTDYDYISFSNAYKHTETPDSYEFHNIEECRQYYSDNTNFSLGEIEFKCNEFAAQFGRFTGSFDKYSNMTNLFYQRDVSEDLNVRTSYSYVLNWSNREGTKDSTQHALQLASNYYFSQATRFSLSYTFRYSSFEDGDDIILQSFRTGIKQYITKHLYLDGRIGLDYPRSGNTQMSGDAILTSELDEKTKANLSYLNDISISENEETTFRNWRIIGALTRSISEDLISSLSFFYGIGEFVSDGVKDTLFGGSCSLSYSFWRNKRGANIGGNLVYSYSDLDSTGENRSYTGRSINAGISLAF